MDNPDTPEPAWEDRGQIFWRLIPMIFFGIIAYLALWLIFVLALIQFVAVVAAEKPHDQLSGFARRLIRYVGEIFRYLMFSTDTMPFPFADFPEAETVSWEADSGGKKAGPAESAKATDSAAQSAGETSGDPRQSAPAGKKSANNKKSGKAASTTKKSGSTGNRTKKSGKGKAAETQAAGKAGNSG